MSTQWDNKETFGEWISKEVYFQDGWPSVMRDPIKKWVSLTEEEVKECFTITTDLFLPWHIYKRIEVKLQEKNR